MKKTDKNLNKYGDMECLSAFFDVTGEMKRDNGEDGYFHSVNKNRVILSVFDGCGGIGSRRYESFFGKTGAYVASRAVCGGVKCWFENDYADSDSLTEHIIRALKVCDFYADKGGRLMGSLGKAFPTTAAITVVSVLEKYIEAQCFWAGDSRCYMLNDKGLHQLSIDDTETKDALGNLSDDGVLRNVISANASFKLNKKILKVKEPCVFLTATDGCFGYMNTPMEFEYLLLETLLSAESIDSWRMLLNKRILEYAGDDYTMGAAAFGFNDFEEMKSYFLARTHNVKAFYIDSDKPDSEKWDLYKIEYYSL